MGIRRVGVEDEHRVTHRPSLGVTVPRARRIVGQSHPRIHRILCRKFSTLMGGRSTIEHHDQLVEVCATRDARAAAELSGRHWSELGGHINKLFDANQFAETAAG
ncbi:FCD domain-containing protein [Streptomyces sp. NPDC017435]|uniref:FCD domain-containing protein n=1 Tax=Streptomyces sp. NPDC017435 TaxID=3364995 RepID=UPI00378F651E